MRLYIKHKEILILFIFSAVLILLIWNKLIICSLIFALVTIIGSLFLTNWRAICQIFLFTILIILWSVLFKTSNWSDFNLRNLLNNLPEKFNLRLYIANYINSNNDKQAAALINLIVLNYKNNLSKEFYYQLINLGVVHLFVVSGLHLSIISRLIQRIFKNYSTFGITISVAVVFGYGYLLGFSFGVLRAVISTLLSFFPLRNSPNKGLTRLSISGLIIMVLNPFAVFDIGFQLSFIGTFALCICSTLVGVPKFALGMLTTFIINLLTAPILLDLNHKINLLTIFNSWLLTPIMFLYYFVALVIFPFWFIWPGFNWMFNLLDNFVILLSQIKIYWYFSENIEPWTLFIYYQVFILLTFLFIKINSHLNYKKAPKINDSHSFSRSRSDYPGITQDSW